VKSEASQVAALMAEALGAIASVLTIVETLAHVTKTIQSCKNAAKESQRLVIELSFIRGLLQAFEDTIEQQGISNANWSVTLNLLDGQNGPLQQFHDFLSHLDARITGISQSKGLVKAKKALEWPFREADTIKVIHAIERYKSLFALALSNDHIALSKAMHVELKSLRTEIIGLQDKFTESAQSLEALTHRTKTMEVDLQHNTNILSGLVRVSEGMS
jgi:hypothetical protein